MDTEFGATQIMVTIPYEGEQAEGEPTDMGQVLHTTYDALAAWCELLGSQSPGQTIQIMLDSATTPEQVDEDGRNPWTIAYESLDAALSDTAAPTMVLTADEASLNDPLASAQQRTLSALGATPTPMPRASRKRSTDTSVAAMFDMAIAEDSTAAAALNQAQEQFYQQFMPEERNNNER